jgi:hypothetical protein
MNRKLLLTFALLFSFALIAVKVEAYDPAYQINVFFGSTPVIDGTINAAEWRDAAPGGFNNTLAYIKQDGRSLYVAFTVLDDTVDPSKDEVSVAIDKNNDGGTSLNSDDVQFVVFRNGTKAEADAGNSVHPSGWEAAATSASDLWQAELNITFSKIGITARQVKTLGVLFSYDDEPNSCYWPSLSASEALAPSNWGNLTSSWIPEFPLFLILPLFMTATLIAFIVYRRKQKKERRKQSYLRFLNSFTPSRSQT